MSVVDAAALASGILDFQSARAVPGLRAFTTLRGYNLGLNTEAPAGEVAASRELLWARAKVPLECSVFMHQVHGDHIEDVAAAERGRGRRELSDALQGTDGLITAERGTYLCVGHADCLAVLVADSRQGVVGAAHMGWRGAAQGIAAKLVRRMVDAHQCKPSDFWIGLSCCLGPCHLELSEARYREFSLMPGYEKFCSPLALGHFNLDLWAAATSALESEGVPAGRIETQRYCTLDHPDAFYSYRGEAGRTGRMMSVIGFI